MHQNLAEKQAAMRAAHAPKTHHLSRRTALTALAKEIENLPDGHPKKARFLAQFLRIRGKRKSVRRSHEPLPHATLDDRAIRDEYAAQAARGISIPGTLTDAEKQRGEAIVSGKLKATAWSIEDCSGVHTYDTEDEAKHHRCVLGPNCRRRILSDHFFAAHWPKDKVTCPDGDACNGIWYEFHFYVPHYPEVTLDA